MKFNEKDNMMMYETMGRELKTYEKSVLSIGCLSKWATLRAMRGIIACAMPQHRQ
ncbi:MAG TPA: hypothetical protein VEK32_02955 [Thermodesulfobacteriota bacterium]|nr:hypothetical protein [Thermodesulfobacteriota bacterium]